MAMRNSTVGAASADAFRIKRFFTDFFLKKVRPAAGGKANQKRQLRRETEEFQHITPPGKAPLLVQRRKRIG